MYDEIHAMAARTISFATKPEAPSSTSIASLSPRMSVFEAVMNGVVSYEQIEINLNNTGVTAAETRSASTCMGCQTSS